MDNTVVDEDVEYVMNKDNAEIGVYMVGDVVKNEGGALWFCISGTPNDKDGGLIDNRAWFISQELNTKREQPRKTAYGNLKADSFIMTDNGTFIDHLGMYNEPLLFIRVMTVADYGGNVPNLVSEDGRKLKVVHLQDDEYLYQSNYNYPICNGLRYNLPFIWLDNEHYTLDFKIEK